MKICQIVDSFPPGWGGSQTHNYTLVKHLLRKGYDVDVIAFRPRSISRDSIREASATTNKGINVYNLFAKTPFSWMHQLENTIKEIEKDQKIDVFDFHNLFNLPFDIKKRKIVLSLHFYELTCPMSRVIYACSSFSSKKCLKCAGTIDYTHWKLRREYATKKVKKFVVKVNHIKELMVKSGIREEAVTVIPHWIDSESIKEKSKRNLRHTIEGLEKNDRIIGFVGRLDPEKGPFLLLKAFSLLSEEMDDVKLVFIGGGTLQRKLELFCKTHDLQNKVIFLGMVPYTNVFEYLSIPDVIVSCQLYDNYGWALLEAMCTKKPIIATNVGATKEILQDGYNALLAMPTAESLSSKMKIILNNRELSRELAENAYNTVRERHGIKNLEKYEQLIQSL